jgi:transcriptional regulator with XRE-family HTH domain
MGLPHLGGRIKAAREQGGLTQNELAARAGVSRIYIAKLEGGDRQSPSLPVLDRIAKVLGVTLVDLLK